MEIYRHTLSGGSGGIGDVIGPAVGTDMAIARYDGDGKHIQNSGVFLNDFNDIDGVRNLTVTGRIAFGSDATLTPVGGDDKFYDLSTTITDFSTGTNWNIFRRELTINSLANYTGIITTDNLLSKTDPANTKNYFLVEGFFSSFVHQGTGAIDAVFGGGVVVSNANSGILGQQDGWDVYCTNDGSGSITTNTGIYVLTGASAGTIPGDNYSIFISQPLSGGTALRNIGLYIDVQSGLAINANTWAIFALGGSKHFLGGDTGVGSGGPIGPQNPRGSLEVGATGSATKFVMSNDGCIQPFTNVINGFPTDVFVSSSINNIPNGGYIFTAASNTDLTALTLKGFIGSTTPTNPAIALYGSKFDGINGPANLTGNEVCVRLGNNGSGAFDILGNNSALFYARALHAKGVSVASANDLVLGEDGNTFQVIGNTQINAIVTTNWTAGSEITLIFGNAPTVKHNTAGGAGTAPIFLAGSVDLAAAANTVLSLVFDGTVWQETGRKAA